MWRRAPARECSAIRDAHDTGLAERSAGISRSVAMKLTGHKTEAVYRRYAIVAENDLREAGTKLAATLDTTRATATHEPEDTT